MKYTIFNEEVLYTTEAVTRITERDVELLKSMAIKNQRQRIRLCAHPDIQNKLHEMIIVLSRGSYVRPHKHMEKSESFHIIEGSLKVLIFDDGGSIQDVLRMDRAGSGEIFFYRLSESAYHTVIPQSSLVVFHETTNGPWNRSDTLYAPWAPEEQYTDLVKGYMDKLAGWEGRPL